MALKHTDKIGKVIPSNWKEGTEFVRGGKFSVGDLVIMERSDGKFRYGEVVKQIGFQWQNSWEVVVSLDLDGTPSATRAENSADIYKPSAAVKAAPAPVPTGSRSLLVQRQLQSQTKTPPPVTPPKPKPQVTRPGAASVRTSPVVRGTAPPTKTATPQSAAKPASPPAPAGGSVWSLFGKPAATPAAPATPPAAKAPAPPTRVPPPQRPAPPATTARTQPSANPLQSLFSSLRPAPAPEPEPEPEPEPTPPPPPAASSNPFAAAFDQLMSNKPAPKPTPKPAAEAPSKPAPVAPPPPTPAPPTNPFAQALEQFLNKEGPGAPAAATEAPPPKVADPAPVAGVKKPKSLGSAPPAKEDATSAVTEALGRLIPKNVAVNLPPIELPSGLPPPPAQLGELADGAAAAAKAAAGTAAAAGKSAALGFLGGLTKVVDAAMAPPPKPAANPVAPPVGNPASSTSAPPAPVQVKLTPVEPEVVSKVEVEKAVEVVLVSDAGPRRKKSKQPNAGADDGLSPTERAKKLAGYKAVDDHVRSGMVVGLGTGSTAYYAVERVGQLLASGELKDIICIPTSERTREQAEKLGIPLCTLDERSEVDVAIDGADAVDTELGLVKGGGGALLREKMVEAAARRFVCIVDESKLCPGLGPSFPLPVEITPFCHLHTLRTIQELPQVAGCEAVLRTGDVTTNKGAGPDAPPAVTDNGNYIVDLRFAAPIKDAAAAAVALKDAVGVVDHGLFIGMASQVIVAGKDGSCRVAGEGGEAPWW